VHRDASTIVPHKHDAVTQDAVRIAVAVRAALHDDSGGLDTITFASPGFGVGLGTDGSIHASAAGM
jgi:hypothetical protein